MIHILSDLLGLSVVVVWAVPFIKAYTDNNLYIAIIPFAAWIVSFVTLLTKKATKRFLPEVSAFHRPNGASNCDLWNRGGDVSGNPGFPSGHTATAAFLATALSFNSSLTIKTGAGLWVCLVAVSRIMKLCHSYLQVISGGLFGLACAYVFMHTMGKN